MITCMNHSFICGIDVTYIWLRTMTTSSWIFKKNPRTLSLVYVYHTYEWVMITCMNHSFICGIDVTYMTYMTADDDDEFVDFQKKSTNSITCISHIWTSHNHVYEPLIHMCDRYDIYDCGRWRRVRGYSRKSDFWTSSGCWKIKKQLHIWMSRRCIYELHIHIWIICVTTTLSCVWLHIWIFIYDSRMNHVCNDVYT